MDSVLVIDDEKSIRALLSRVLAQQQIEVHTAATGAEGLQRADELAPDLVLLDLRLPDAGGLDVLKALRARHPETAVVIMTAFGQVQSAVEAMKSGATDYLEKPFEPLDKLRLAVDRALQEVKARREIQRLQAREATRYRSDQLVGVSPAMQRLREVVLQLANSEAHTILVLGESGTGKELVAKGLHYCGPRRREPFVEVNCAAIADSLFESEVFGHEKGAFTDAKIAKKGLLELADRGTLFLDEISEMSPGSQAKLLRCLQDRAFKRVGGTRDLRVDVRVIAASNRPLAEYVKQGRFREDLFYRLNVIPISVSPLRERPEDILPLARHFLNESNAAFHRKVSGFRPDAEQTLLAHDWPGNVRELKNLIERVVILHVAEWIEAADLPLPGRSAPPANGGLHTLEDMERRYILQVVEHVEGNKSKAAKILGISRQTLRRKVEAG